MDASKGFKGMLTGAGIVLAVPKTYSDIQFLLGGGELKGMALLDAVKNIVSAAGTPGAAISLVYVGGKKGAESLQYIDREAQRTIKGTIKDIFNWIS